MKYNECEDKKKFSELRDKLQNEGISIYYDIFHCGNNYFSVRAIYYKKQIYIMKRVNRACTEIINLCDEYKEVKKGLKDEV